MSEFIKVLGPWGTIYWLMVVASFGIFYGSIEGEVPIIPCFVISLGWPWLMGLMALILLRG